MVKHVFVFWMAAAGIVVAQAPAGYKPPTAEERAIWALNSSFGPRSIATGVFSQGFGVLIDRPKEWGRTWEGFGKRIADRTATVAISNHGEALLGSIWGEDPRYITDRSGTFKQRLKRALVQSVAHYNRSGELRPSYAFYIGNVGSNLVANTWQPDSVNSVGNGLVSSIYGVTGRMFGNAFSEFWPDMKKRLSRSKTKKP